MTGIADLKTENGILNGKRRKVDLDEANLSLEHPSNQGTPCTNYADVWKSDNPRLLIPKLCRLMYDLGWATGTGGGLSMKQKNTIYMAPSGVQKEMIHPEDIFECDCDGDITKRPEKPLKLTACAPLFMNAFTLRGAGAVLHSHAKICVLVSMLVKGKELRFTHLEMMKGIKKGSTSEPHRYDDMLVIPIIENVCHERDLTNRMRYAMKLYPETNAVLVRRHGVYIWGDSWQGAKAQAECYHYLFEIAVEMIKSGLDPAKVPTDEGGITHDDDI